MSDFSHTGSMSTPRKGLVQRVVAQIRSDIHEFMASSPGTSGESMSFQSYATAKTMLITRLMAVAGAANLIVWAPTDLWVYRKSTYLIWSLLAFRVMTLVILAGAFMIFSTTPPNRQTAWRIVAWYWIIVSSIFALFGYVSNPGVPILYTALLVPTATAAFLVPLRMRIGMTVGGVAAFMLSYFGPHPDYWSYPYADMLFVDLLFSCVLGILLGDFIYRLERTAFAQRQAIEQHALELEDLDRAKDSFVATISHELRTPLNSIVGLTDVVLDEKLTPEVKGYVRTIRKSGEVLQRLINDVLDLAKIRAGKLEMESRPFALQDVIENCVALFMVASEEKGLTLSYDVPWNLPELVGDEGRVSQILLNLIGNAVKFTPSGEIRVEAHWSRRPADQRQLISLRVSDTGTGIPADKREAVFEEFAQVDASTSRRFGGTGLGLPIVRRLARLMGGEVTLDNNGSHGSVFTVTLPLPQAPEPREPPPKLPAGIIHGGQTVIVCASNALSRSHLVDSVAHLGLPVEAADSENAALNAIARLQSMGREIGLILLELTQPSPGQFARSALLGVTSRIGIVLITSSRAGADDLATLRNLGARAVLFRPARRLELRDAIANALGDEPLSGARTLSMPPKSRSPARRVLVVDDVADNRLLLQAFVKGRPVQLDVAASGEEGLSLFHRNRYDAVFLDIQMPEMDGYAVIDRMRAWEKEHQRTATPIIALTAHVTGEHQLLIRQHGFSRHLTKPIRKREFLDFLADLSSEQAPAPLAQTALAVDPNDLSHLLPAYFHNRQEDTVALVRYLGEGNFHEIGRIGHKLQGSGGSYGFHDISAIGTRMEEAANRHDVNEVRITIAELESSIARHYGNA